MSALGSSVINKSNKKFAPRKAPVRRSGVPNSVGHFARPSEERQSQSQTPQPPSVLFPAQSPPAPPRAPETSTSSQEHQISGQTGPVQDHDAIHVPLPSQLAPVSREPSHPSSIPQKRPIASINQQSHTISFNASTVPPIEDLHSQTSTSNDGLVRRTPQPIAQPTPSTERATGSNHRGSSKTSVQPPKDDLSNTKTRAVKRRKGNEQPQRLVETETRTTQGGKPTSIAEGLQSGPSSVATSAVPAKTTSNPKSKKPPRDKTRKSMGSSAPKPITLQAEGQEEIAIDTPATEPANQKKASKCQRPKQSRREKAIQDVAADIVEDAVRGSARTPRKKSSGQRRRASTPENAEDVTIDPEEIRMIELCQDSHTGRKSLREQELREMDRAAFVKRKQRELQEMMGQAASPDIGGSAEPSQDQESRQERQKEREHEVALQVPNTIIRDGQIQIDEDSLRIDRHAAAAVERDLDDLPPIDENDLSRKITAGSFLKRDSRGGWNEMLLERFYQGLRMFGTDFDLISRMFPGKTRHAIKRKFVKEERFDYPRIKAALLGEKAPVILEEYEKLTGAEYEDPAELDKIMEEDRKQLEEEQAAEKAAMEEAEKQREETAAAERAAAAEENSGLESSGKKKRSKKGKRKGKQKEGQRPRRPRKKKDVGLGGDGFLVGADNAVGLVTPQATA